MRYVAQGIPFAFFAFCILLAIVVVLIAPVQVQEPPTTYCAMEVTYREMVAGELVESSICMDRVEVQK